MLKALLALVLAGGLPPALQHAVNARKQINKAHVIWSWTYYTQDDFFDGKPQYFENLYAPQQAISIAHGTPDGTTTLWDDQPYRAGSERYLHDVASGRSWHTFGDNPDVDLRTDKIDPGFIDPRALGLTPYPSPYPTVNEDDLFRRFRREEVAFTERVLNNGLYQVELEMERDAKVQWLIDPQLGWNVVRCAILRDDRPTMTCQARYERRGRYWFPISLTYHNVHGELSADVEVHKARFGDDLPDRLRPEDIGVETGMTVEDGEGVHAYADGELISIGEFWRRWEQGLVTRSPKVLKFAEQGGHLVPPVETWHPAHTGEFSIKPCQKPVLGEWDRYVIDFSSKYELNDEQKDKALQILAQCKERRDALLARESARAMTLGESLQPKVDAIFEEQLKPRLDRLLTRAQRKRHPPPDSDESD